MSKIIILTIWLLNTYDIGSPTWGDLRKTPLQSAMEIIFLGHGPSWSTIDPVQVSMIVKYWIEKKKKKIQKFQPLNIMCLNQITELKIIAKSGFNG